MTNLPRPALPSGTITLDGTLVEYHSLSRSQVLRLASYDDDKDAAEDFMLACALDISIEDAHAWREAVTVEVGGQLSNAIIEISGLDKLNGTADPKAAGR